jgi:hypothetical protein
MKSAFKSIGTILSFLKPGNTDKNEEYITKPISKIKKLPGSTVIKNEPSFRSSLTKPLPGGILE